MSTTTTIIPAVEVSADFLEAIREAIEAIESSGIAAKLQRVYEVVRPEHAAVTADLGNDSYETFTRVTGYSDLFDDLTHLARAAKLALGLHEADLQFPSWVSDEDIAAADAAKLVEAHGLIRMVEELQAATSTR